MQEALGSSTSTTETEGGMEKDWYAGSLTKFCQSPDSQLVPLQLKVQEGQTLREQVGCLSDPNDTL